MAAKRVSEAATTIEANKLRVVLATDCGSTTTKAVLFEKKEDGWRQTFRGEAPTTVEKPVADVTIGAKNAFLEVQELAGRQILSREEEGDKCPLLIREGDGSGVDLYVSTSSAGGGLQMIVAGVVSNMTTASAERAALGAGAIVMDAVSIDDGREQYERVRKVRHLRPDIVLIAGGAEGGTISHPLELAETILQADPRPRFGETLKLPVIYAANSKARVQAEEILRQRFEFIAVDNIRPALERENLAPARNAIHELFLNHVMSHAPGYRKLMSWSPVAIMPTPAAVGDMVLAAAEKWNLQILAVDIGGATTDVFSVFRGGSPDQAFVFNRTVSANLGMSYSVGNVLIEAGEDNIRRWLPFRMHKEELRDRLCNKMIRPTSIPYTIEDLLLEQAVAREALRLAFIHHRRLAVGLKGTKQRRSIGDFFRQSSADSLLDMIGLDLIIGSGGVLSHAPERRSGALMLIDAYEPEGVTRLAVDSIFMMPHLGVFASVDKNAAAEIFVRDCLIDLGTVIAPVVAGRAAMETGAALAQAVLPDGRRLPIRCGEIQCCEYEAGERGEIVVVPASRRVDAGSGPGKTHRAQVYGGYAGIVLDGRGRPLVFPAAEEARLAAVQQWYRAFGLKTE
ncbi:MAG TPA: glutamate mutase L [Oligoflexia bacterium]|nr:glutamate mutase L [Oligoflexia bacterium]